jgi:hypothetical protein
MGRDASLRSGQDQFQALRAWSEAWTNSEDEGQREERQHFAEASELHSCESSCTMDGAREFPCWLWSVSKLADKSESA